MRKQKREDVVKELEWAQKHNPELQPFHLENADGRVGKKLAIAERGESGTISIKTDYKSYDEMVAFLRGYCFKGENRFKLDKLYNVKYNVGKVKYLISYHDGIKKHKDGSRFFDIHTESNKKRHEAKLKELQAEGYVEESMNL